ncbi:MAG: 2'-5' RNA ligase family protein [Chitinophagaceae bacterium]|nr:2'-5' RNA ligase family protein [Chitinophagaceae bacterium]
MEKNIFSLPGYREHEYLLVLKPHDELCAKIRVIKDEFAEKYKAPTARFTKPHVTLVKFFQYEMMEEKILNRLKIIAMGMYPFKVELVNFGSLPSHTIFINVTTKVQIQELVKQVKSAQQLLKHKETKPHFIEEIYIPIARKLLPWQYEKGWLEYSNKHFTGRFIADSMLLLKIPAGRMKYQIMQRFEFMNLPVTTKQGDLF